MDDITRASEAIAAGELVVYPTETVYGLGADAFSPKAIDRVFALKDRPRDRPLSVAIPTLDAIEAVARPSGTTHAFMETFLPGPVTVVCEKQPALPGALTSGSDRVGIRIPDQDVARGLLERTGPLTATSANVSGGPDVRDPDDLATEILEGVSVVLDDGRTPGGVSTVVDPEEGVIHRAGLEVEAVQRWLDLP